MSVHLLSIYINELDNRTEDTLLLHLQMMKLGENAWTKNKVRFQNEHDNCKDSQKHQVKFCSGKCKDVHAFKDIVLRKWSGAVG